MKRSRRHHKKHARSHRKPRRARRDTGHAAFRASTSRRPGASSVSSLTSRVNHALHVSLQDASYLRAMDILDRAEDEGVLTSREAKKLAVHVHASRDRGRPRRSRTSARTSRRHAAPKRRRSARRSSARSRRR